MDIQNRSSFIRKQITSADGKKSLISELKPIEQMPVKKHFDRKMYNADKENIVAIQNIQMKFDDNKSPKLDKQRSPKLNQKVSPKMTKNGIKDLNIRSPDRPVYMPSGFRSNKANDCAIDIGEQLQKCSEISTIYSGMSKDGKYQILSKAFTGRQLQKARIYEMKVNSQFRQKKQSQLLNERQIPDVEQAKASSKQNGLIKSYAVNTHQGISRNYNEDRVSVILNINKNGVKSTFFAIYDGHGGTGCCDFLRDYLHEYIINHQSFPEDPKKAIVQGIHKVQAKFIELAKKKFMKSNQLDRSGSCAIIVIIIGRQCYTANIGDSRAFLSKSNGKIISHLSRDHKPYDQKQQKRIISNGGKIYRTEMTRMDKLHIEDKLKLNDQQFIIGPLRVFPGKLSVTRTLGDIEAKDRDFQGIPECVWFEPEISKFTIDKNDDFLFLGCDGIFQKLQSVEVSKLIWKVINDNPGESIHKLTGKCIDEVLKESMRRKSSDNLTAIIVNLREDLGLKSADESKSLIRDLSCRSL